jgi:hypothetical protein
MRKVIVFALFLLFAASTAWGAWDYVYTQDCGDRVRGMAILGTDDAFVGINYAPRSAEWYYDMPDTAGAFDYQRPTFVLDALNYTYSYNWGAGLHDGLIYHAVQDVGATDSYILVWDGVGNEVDYLLTGIDPSGTEYPTACDCDAAGNVYMSLYIDGATFDQVTVYPPRTSWVAHTATPISSCETGAYVGEGMCVNQAGTVIWATNRSATGSLGWAARFTAPGPTGPWTQDMLFAGDGFADVNGYVRAVDVDEGGDRIFVCSDQNPGDSIFVFNATTGARIETFCVDDATIYGGDTYHTSPYDIEFDPVEGALYIQHYYGWYVDKWVETPQAVTMSSFEAIGAEEQVELTWRVESEYENVGYRIFRDADPIAFVEGRGNSDSPLTYTWIDKDVTAGTTYRYRIADVDLNGNETMHDFVAEATPKPAATVPTSYALAQNYPNPFNADTQIRFSLAEAGHTTLKIYNTTGQLIATLVDGHLAARVHTVRWDGRNSKGEVVASGIYFYRLSSGNFAETKKMSFLR